MAKHVIASVRQIPDGGRLATTVKGRPVVVFNHGGEYFALLDRCPHSGAQLSKGLLTGLVQSDAPGCFKYSRAGEIIKCPWHGWEFDIKTGQSYCSPDTVKTRAYAVQVQHGCDLGGAPLAAETLPITIEQDYVVLEM